MKTRTEKINEARRLLAGEPPQLEGRVLVQWPGEPRPVEYRPKFDKLLVIRWPEDGF